MGTMKLAPPAVTPVGRPGPLVQLNTPGAPPTMVAMPIMGCPSSVQPGVIVMLAGTLERLSVLQGIPWIQELSGAAELTTSGAVAVTQCWKDGVNGRMTPSVTTAFTTLLAMVGSVTWASCASPRWSGGRRG